MARSSLWPPLRSWRNSTVTKWSSHATKVVDKLTVDGTEYKSAVKAFYDVDTLEDYDLDLLTDMSYMCI